MQPWIRVLLLLMLLLGELSVHAVAWISHPARGAIIYVPAGQTALAERVGRLADAEIPRVAQALALPQVSPVPVFVYTSRQAFLHDAGAIPYLEGISQHPSGVIRIIAPLDDIALRHLFAHELTHSLLSQRLGPALSELPAWVNEGIAGHLSEPVSTTELPAISRLIHRDGVLSTQEMEEAFATHESSAGAYLQSRSMIAWLVYHHPRALTGILARLAAGEDFDAALRAEAGLTTHAWWEQWQAAIPPIVYWITALGSPLLYAPLALLCMLLALYQIRKRKEERDRQDEEEQASRARETPDQDDDDEDYLEEYEE